MGGLAFARLMERDLGPCATSPRRSLLVGGTAIDYALATGVLMVLLGPVLVHTTARSLRTRERGDWRKGIEEESR